MAKPRFFGVLKCRHCNARMVTSVESYKQNPYCTGCLGERLQHAALQDPLVGWRRIGDYTIPVRLSDLESD